MDFRVSPSSYRQIHRRADQLRKIYPRLNDDYVDIVSFVELDLYGTGQLDFEICDDLQMGPARGRTQLFDGTIMLGESTYSGAIKGMRTDRFTLAHELWHSFFHAGQNAVAEGELDRPLMKFQSAEWQANEGAAEILVNRHRMEMRVSDADLSKRHGVSRDVIKHRRKNLQRAGYKSTHKQGQFELDFKL